MMTNLLNGAHVANKLFSTIARLRLLLVMFMTLSVSANAWAEEVTFLPNELTAVTSTYYSHTKENITIAVTASTVTAEEFRIFKNQTLTISTTNDNKITGVEITCTKENTTKYGPGCFGDYDGYSYSSYVGTWSGSANSISLKASKDQVRATSIVVTYSSASSGDPVDPPTTYTIKWHTAKGVTTDVTLNEGATITKPATDPTMTGYEFMGWTEDCEVASDGDGFTAITNFGTATEDKDYYAVFAEPTTPDGGSTDVTMDLTTEGQITTNTTTSLVFTAGDVTFTNTKGNSQTNANNYCPATSGQNYTSTRTYKGQTVSITATNTISKIVITAATNNYATAIAAATWTGGTASASSSTVIVTPNSGVSTVSFSPSATAGMTKVVVTTSGGGGSTTYFDYRTTCATETSVSFELNDGSGTFETENLDGDSYTIPEKVPTRNGYNFAGWKINGEGDSYQPGATINGITESITLVAQWTAIQTTITLNANGGSGNTTSVAATYDSSTLNPSSITNPTKTGHTFGGWYSGEGGTGSLVINSSGKLQANVSGFTGTNGVWKATTGKTLHAGWTINSHTLTWEVNGGNALTGSYTSGTVEYGATITNPADPTRTGYSFLGWHDGTDIVPPATTMPDHDLTYTAQWTANTYTVEFNANGGTGSISNQSFTYGQSQSLTANAYVRTGYAFKHWTINQDGTGTSYSNEQSVNNLTAEDKATVTLYAQWTPNVYEITLHTNGGTINAGNVTSYEYGAGATLPTNVTKEHYQFGGWFDNSGCTGTAVTTISTTATGDKEYWAKWTELPKYTVTWSVDGNTTTEEVYSGDKVTKAPTIDENNLPCDGADKFEGWTTGEYQGDSAPGTLYPRAADIPAITGDVTFYAVFADYAD